MPNIRGGKGYKSGKGKSKLGDDEIVYLERQSDQMVGRIVRILGDLNTSVYCQDNKQRICKICRSIKKSVRFEVGDIVLVSLRDCEVSKAELLEGKRGDKGDILNKYHPYQFSELKKEGINPHLFTNMNTLKEMATLIEEGKEEAAIKLAEKTQEEADDDIFDRDKEEEEDEDDKKEKVIVEKKDKVNHRKNIIEKELTFDDL
jgi:initiation factor 1A